MVLKRNENDSVPISNCYGWMDEVERLIDLLSPLSKQVKMLLRVFWVFLKRYIDPVIKGNVVT